MIGLLALALASPSAAPVAPERPLTVDEAWDRHDELDGMTIQIVGTLRSCSQNRCVITDGMMAGGKWLGVDLSKEARFDPDALIRHRMIVEGRFDATCVGGKAICLDSPTMMHDARIVELP